MEKPSSEIIEQIISVIEDMREMESAIKELKEKANSLVSNIVDESNKLDIAAYLYWLYPEIRAKELAHAVIGESNVHKFLNSIQSVTANINCDRCEQLVEIKSRTQLNEEIKRTNSGYSHWAEGYRVLCKTCQTEVMAERHAQSQTSERARNQRLNELIRMPYREYLQTPEWKERRLKHLKSVGHRCQVCNSPIQPLDVHHRTYERRGLEYYKDLIVLCRDCHSTFHDAGKLADH
jgi:hypothetical protein